MHKAELIEKINHGWNQFQAYLATLSPADYTANTDAAGWTVKDHIMHLAVWEDGVRAMFDGHTRHLHMGVAAATWATNDFDAINASIRDQHASKSVDAVLTELEQVHARMMDKLGSLSDSDLQRPYDSFEPDAKRDQPIINWVISDTYEHYAEHQPWIAAIVAGS